MHKNVSMTILAISLALPSPLLLANSEFEDWLNREIDAYESYQGKLDRQFINQLNKSWKEYRLSTIPKSIKEPKPTIFPTAPLPKIVVRSPDDEPVKKVKIVSSTLSPPKEVVRPTPRPTTSVIPQKQQLKKKFKTDFYGDMLSFSYDPAAIKRFRIGKIDKKSISRYWNSISKTNHPELIKEIKHYKKQLILNDWGTIRLVSRIAETLYPSRRNEQRLFIWFTLNKLELNARVGFNDQGVHLMIAANSILYGKPYYTYNNVKFYVIHSQGGEKSRPSLYSYDAKFPGETSSIKLSLTELPNIKNRIQSKKLGFNFNGKEYDFSVDYNDNLSKFFNDYPLTEFSVYFSSPISNELNSTLLENISESIKEMSETDALNFILRFVQTAFRYKTDEEQFGEEKYFFAEELFIHKYSDCEDRSVLFSYLVRKLLGKEMVALKYPGHLATAIHISEEAKGEFVKYRGKKYTIADPTYENASIGMVMPRFKNSSPEVIPLTKI